MLSVHLNPWAEVLKKEGVGACVTCNVCLAQKSTCHGKWFLPRECPCTESRISSRRRVREHAFILMCFSHTWRFRHRVDVPCMVQFCFKSETRIELLRVLPSMAEPVLLKSLPQVLADKSYCRVSCCGKERRCWTSREVSPGSFSFPLHFSSEDTRRVSGVRLSADFFWQILPTCSCCS